MQRRALVKPKKSSKKSIVTVNDQLRAHMGGGTTPAILAFLSPKDISATLSTCRILKQFGDSNRAWHSVLEAQFGSAYVTKTDSKLQYQAHVLLKKALEAKFDKKYERFQKLKEYLDQRHSHTQPESIPWTFYFYAHYFLYGAWQKWRAPSFGLRALEAGDLRMEKPLFEFFVNRFDEDFTCDELKQFGNLLERENSIINSTHTQTVLSCRLAMRADYHPREEADILQSKALSQFFEYISLIDNLNTILNYVLEILSALQLSPTRATSAGLRRKIQKKEIKNTLDILMDDDIYSAIKEDDIFHALLVEHLKELISQNVGAAAYYYAQQVLIADAFYEQLDPSLDSQAQIATEAKPYLIKAVQHGDFRAIVTLRRINNLFKDILSDQALVDLSKKPALEGHAISLFVILDNAQWRTQPSLVWILLSNLLKNRFATDIKNNFEKELQKIEKGSMWARCALTILYALNKETQKALDQYQIIATHMPMFLAAGRANNLVTKEIENAVNELENQKQEIETPLRKSHRRR